MTIAFRADIHEWGSSSIFESIPSEELTTMICGALAVRRGIHVRSKPRFPTLIYNILSERSVICRAVGS